MAFLSKIVLLSLWLSPHLNGAVYCESPTMAASSPQLSQKKWNRFANRFITRAKPFHEAWDLVTKEGLSGRMEAKFDYGSIIHKDLEGEWISVFYRSKQNQHWHFLEEILSDNDGRVSVQLPALALGAYEILFKVQGDLTEARGNYDVLNPDQALIVVDLDGTMTKSDEEALKGYLEIGNVQMYPGAATLIRFYRSQGFFPIYLTARGYFLIPSTRRWLAENGFPEGHLHFSDSVGKFLDRNQHAAFKGDYLIALQDQGWQIRRAYGNALTDIEAYEAAGIAKEDTFIIGEHAGKGFTQVIEGDYLEHLRDVTIDLPKSPCPNP